MTEQYFIFLNTAFISAEDGGHGRRLAAIRRAFERRAVSVNWAGYGKPLGSGFPVATGAMSQAIRKRSITIAGHRTSVSLEDAFWAVLGRLAAARGRSVSDLVTQIDRERTGNLSSAIRVFVLTEVAAGFGAESPPGRAKPGAGP